MLASDFWRDLAEQFESVVDDRGFLRAHWSTVGNVRSWQILTAREEYPELVIKCEAFIVRTGIQLDPSREPKDAWLDEILNRVANGTLDGSGVGRDEAKQAEGTLGYLAVISGSLCRRLEVESLKAELNHTEINSVSPKPELAKPQKARFLQRSEWTAERLKERGWDRNHPNRFSGPDRKTVQKILDGKFVRPEALERLVVALNRKKIGKPITLSDVPSN